MIRINPAPASVAPEELPTLPKVEVPDLLEDGRVPLALMNQPLQIHVPKNDDSAPDDVIWLLINTVKLGYKHELSESEVKNPDFKVHFDLPQTIFPGPGEYKVLRLSYEYIYHDTEKSPRTASELIVLLDREPPGGAPLSALEFTEDQRSGITREHIVDGYLSVLMYPWYGMETGDIVTPWINTAPPLPGSDIEQHFLNGEEITITEPGRNTHLKFPEGTLQEKGPHYFGYRLTDKLGNASDLSPLARIDVDLDASTQRGSH